MLRRAFFLLTVLIAAAAPAVAQTGADDPREEARAVQGEVAALRAHLADLIRDQTAAQARVGPDRARFEVLNVREQALQVEVGKNRSELGRLLSALQLFSRNPPPALLVSPRSANEAVTAAILMRAVTPELQRRAAVLRDQSQTYQRARRETALAHEALFTGESEAADRRAQIERLIAEKTGLEARLRADAVAADAATRAQAEQSAALNGLVQGVNGQTPRASGGGDPGKLAPPVAGERIAGFAPAGTDARSGGVTWRARASAPVLAPAAGVVEYAGPLKGWGQVVVISLGGDWRVVLAGLERIAVRAGAPVRAGQPLGLMGTRGRPELYMEVRQGAAVTDPARRLDAG
jgi:septal ring factor EnvC (AmiA/AmiB activator)